METLFVLMEPPRSRAVYRRRRHPLENRTTISRNSQRLPGLPNPPGCRGTTPRIGNWPHNIYPIFPRWFSPGPRL